MSTTMKYSIQTAALSALMFFVGALLGFNSLFLLLSAVPLLYAGRRLPFNYLPIAAAMASFALLLVSSGSSLFYMGFVAVPSFFFVARMQTQGSMMDPIIDNSLYAMLALALTQYGLADMGGMGGWLNSKMDDAALASLDPALQQQVAWLLDDGSYILIGMLVWWSLWVLLLASWFADRFWQHRHGGDQGNQQITVLKLPNWLPGLLVLVTLLGFSSAENLRFVGMLSFIIILLPYAFWGAMYTPLRSPLLRQNGWALVLIMILMVLAWPMVIIAAYGLLRHIQSLLIKESRE